MSKRFMVILLLIGAALLSGGPAVPAGAADEESPARDAGRRARDEAAYDKGRMALDAGDWQTAVDSFAEAARPGGARADAACYWKAYALNKLGRRPEALASLEVLKGSYPDSRWIADMKALEVEIKQSLGRSVPAEAESDDEIKLVAINGLLNVDPERALPMLERFIEGDNAPRLKEQALFVLAQSGSPRARDLIARIARGQSNPDLQPTALQYLGMLDDDAARSLLKDIYASSSDPNTRRAILRAYMTAGETGPLLQAAKTEKDAQVRHEAIQLLGAQGAGDELWGLLREEPSVEIKEQILLAMAISGESARLLDIARTGKDPRLRRAAIQGLGIAGPEDSAHTLVSLYWSERDRDVKRSVLDALLVRGDARAIIDIVRKETDQEMRKEAVSRLSTMGSKEATDFLIELLNE